VLPRLYAVCDAEVCARAGWTLTDFASACLDGGASFLQIRAKTLSSAEFLRAADAIVARAADAGALVIVNDRADIARLAGAAGVHVGQDDLAPADVRRLLGETAVVGVSTHTHAQLDTAVTEPVSYVAIGPVFGTSTKATGYAAVGLDMVRDAVGRAGPRGLPVAAIGGITLDNALSVIAAGAGSVAVITDLLYGGAPAARVRAYVDRLAAYNR
jgi:thiamine-phosphate pyrophosphorylase